MKKTIAWMNAGAAFIWSRMPHYGARISPSLGRIALDGQYLSGLPLVGALLPLVTFCIGFGYAAFGKGDLPIYTADIYVLALLVGCAVLSGQMGLLAFLGYALGDLFYFAGYEQDTPSIAFPFAVLLSWLFLFQLLVTFPRISRQLSAFKGALGWLNGLVAALFVAGFTELWTRLTMIVLRPVFLWQGIDIDLRLVAFGERHLKYVDVDVHFLTWCALGAGLLRWVLAPIFSRFLSTAPYTADDLPTPIFKANWPLAVTLALSAIMFTFMMSGIFFSVWEAGLFLLAVYLLTFLRAVASGKMIVARWDGWMRAIPVAIRLIATYVFALAVALVVAPILRDMFGLRTMATAAAGIVVSIALILPLWPQTSDGQPAPRLPEFVSKFLPFLRPSVVNVLLLLCLLTAGPAFAHHCSFQPGCECLTNEGALAALIAAATTIGALLLMLALDQTPVGVAHDVHDAVTGRDLLTGERLAWWERALATWAAFPIIGLPADVLQKLRKADKIKKSSLVRFDGEFATKQLLGTTSTPGGRQVMFHAADRMVNPPSGRVPMSVSEVDNVLDGATRVVKYRHHPQGPTLEIENANMPGRPRVVVDAETGQRVITVINPRKK